MDYPTSFLRVTINGNLNLLLLLWRVVLIPYIVSSRIFLKYRNKHLTFPSFLISSTRFVGIFSNPLLLNILVYFISFNVIIRF